MADGCLAAWLRGGRAEGVGGELELELELELEPELKLGDVA